MSEGQIVLGLWLVIVTNTLYVARVFDRLLIKYYLLDRDGWTAAGQPNGFFWYPGGRWYYFFCGQGSAKNRAGYRLAYKWFWKTPAWVASSPEDTRVLVCYRWATVTQYSLVAAFFLWSVF